MTHVTWQYLIRIYYKLKQLNHTSLFQLINFLNANECCSERPRICYRYYRLYRAIQLWSTWKNPEWPWAGVGILLPPAGVFTSRAFLRRVGLSSLPISLIPLKCQRFRSVSACQGHGPLGPHCKTWHAITQSMDCQSLSLLPFIATRVISFILMTFLIEFTRVATLAFLSSSSPPSPPVFYIC